MFCAGVCPLGAIQDVFLLKPIRVPPWLESSLRLLAYVYLGLAVLFAATGAAFVICRYDPFIGFFRLSATLNMLIVGLCFLVVGIFVGRPYCRFFCPYGILLRHISRLSKWRVSITPDDCINCRLCQNACPFGAIESPAAEWAGQDYDNGRKRLAFALGVLPVLIFLGSWGVSLTAGAMSRVHPTVRLADRIDLEESGQVKDTTDASAAFRGTERGVEELYAQAVSIQSSMRLGSWIIGGFVGLVIGLKLIRHCVRRPRTDYEADRAQCLACGRCFEYCPRERLRLKNIDRKTPAMGNSSE
jgi:ferredoxin